MIGGIPAGTRCARCARLADTRAIDGATMTGPAVCQAHFAEIWRELEARRLEARAQALRTFTDEEAGRHVAS